jgi:hypothetical protein
MARKDVLANWPMFGVSGADMSANATSQITTIQFMDNIGILINWSGSSPVGTLFIEISNDNKTFTALEFGSSISISGNSGTHTVTINQAPFGYLRARYALTSGTGNLTAILSSKQIGG